VRILSCAAAGFVLTAAGAAPGVTEQAKSAARFVDSIGVNTHYVNAIYTGQNGYSFEALDQKLADLGIRHIRDNADGAEPYSFTRLDNLYATHGVRAILVPNSTASGPLGMLNLVKAHPVFEAVEGLNEPDFGTPRTYKGLTDNQAAKDFPATRTYLNDLYAAVKGDPQTAGVKVLSSAMGSTANMQYLNGASFDVASMHSYPNGRNPTFSLDTHISRTNLSATPPKPIWATETGYYNKPNDGGQVSEVATGKYMPRLFGEYFNRGVVRTYSYELVDQNPTTDKESNFGLLRWDLTPKPAYTAMKNVISLLGGPASEALLNAPTSSLTYTIPTSPASLHHTLLQRADGAFVLMLWNEVSSWDRTNFQDINNTPLSVTLTLPAGTIDRARVFLPGQSATPTATYTNPTTMFLSVPDQMLMVELVNVPEPGGVALVAGVVTALSRRRTRAGGLD
jgi:hypothetical protein